MLADIVDGKLQSGTLHNDSHNIDYQDRFRLSIAVTHVTKA